MKTTKSTRKLLFISAIITISGIVLSGPIGILLTLIKPQPSWQDATTFIANFHPIQSTPYLFGFILILGFTLFISSSFRLAETGTQKIFRIAAILFTAVYIAFVGLNYAIQIALVPALVFKSPTIASTFTMANPNSLGWILEMFGYGFLGVATIFIAPFYNGSPRLKTIKFLLILNGIISIVGAGATAFGMEWILALPGIVSVILWNLLIAAIMILIIIEIRLK